MYIGSYSSVVLDGLKITRGRSFGEEGDGGGVWLSWAGTVTFKNCDIYSNTASGGWGGGVYIVYTRATFINCNIYSNKACRGAGIMITGLSASATLTGCAIYDNTAMAGGGGREAGREAGREGGS